MGLERTFRIAHIQVTRYHSLNHKAYLSRPLDLHNKVYQSRYSSAPFLQFWKHLDLLTLLTCPDTEKCLRTSCLCVKFSYHVKPWDLLRSKWKCTISFSLWCRSLSFNSCKFFKKRLHYPRIPWQGFCKINWKLWYLP